MKDRFLIKVSVIIPVYNVEPYLEECLDSVINQSLKDIEIICIDDCSSDNSYNILLKYTKKDKRLIIRRNDKNMGSGPTRNIGMKIAQGEYLSFIDPDDYISTDFLESLYNTAKKFDSDIVTTLNVLYDENGKIYEKFMNINKFLSKKEKNNPSLYMEGKTNASIKDLKYFTKEYIYITLTNKLHKKQFLLDHDLFYMDIKSGADDEDLFNRIMLNKPKCSYNHKGIYYHRKRNNSLMSNSISSLEYLIDTIKLMENSINYCQNNFPEYLDLIYKRALDLILERLSKTTQKEKFYPYVHNFIANIYTNEPYILHNNIPEYLIIKSNSTYSEYLLDKYLLKKINELKYDINKSRNIKLFGIDKFNDKKIIYLFGIKITLKSRAEQTRYIYFNNKTKYNKFQPTMQHKTA